MPRKAPVYAPLAARACDLSGAELAGGGVMTTREVAAFLRLHPQTVKGLIAAGEIPSAKLGRRRVLYRNAVIRWLELKRS